MMIRSALVLTVTLCACLALPQSVRADAKWDELYTEFEKAYETWAEEMANAHSASGGSAMMITDMSAMPKHPADDFRPRIRSYAEKHLGQDDTLPALAWLVTKSMGMMGPMGGDSADAKWALEQIKKDHITAANLMVELEGLSMAVMAVGEDPLVELLQAIAEKNPVKKNKGLAQLRLAEILYEGSPFASIMGMGGTPDRSEKQTRAKKILRSLTKDFADHDIGDQAEGLLFAFEHLQVGKKLPALSGTTADGTIISLADYRGKVIAIVFWATWCAPCMEMIPHERALLEEFKDKPFALIGINVDDDPTTVRKAIKKENITWPTILDGAPHKEGSISTKWRIRHFPTIFIVDRQGVIRKRDIPPPFLEDAIKSVLADVGTQ